MRSYTYAPAARRGRPLRRGARRRSACGKGDRVVDLHADGPRGGRRDARLRAARGDPLGGLRRLRRRTSWPSASTTPGPRWSSPPPAASSPAGSSSTSRCWTRRSRSPRTPPQAASSLQRPQAARGARARPRHRLGRGHGWGRAPRRASRSPPPTRCTSSTPRAPPGSRRASCATTAATRSALNWSMKNVYAVGPGESVRPASDMGWVVGHSYIVYAPLLHGATTVLYEGKPVGTPDAGQFWRVVADHGVKALFTAPTAFRAIKREDPKGEPRRRVRPLGAEVPLPRRRAPRPGDLSAGPRDQLDVPVIDHWWQTETGWPIVANRAGIELLPIKPGSATRPVPGLGRAGPRRRRACRPATAPTARSWSGCRCRRGRCRRCGTPRSASSTPT